MAKFTIGYVVRNHGWATVNFANEEGECESSVSYLHDSLGQLADMALELKRGLSDAKAIFMDEPGELQFVVDVINDEASYEVRHYRDWASWGMHPQEVFDVLLKGTCQPNRIIQQISNVLWKIHEEMGPQEYLKRWSSHEFPLEKYKLLLEK